VGGDGGAAEEVREGRGLIGEFWGWIAFYVSLCLFLFNLSPLYSFSSSDFCSMPFSRFPYFTFPPSLPPPPQS